MGGGPSRGSSDESASSLEDPSRDGVLVVRMNRGGRYNSYPDYRAQSYGYGTGGAGYNPNVSSRRTSQQSGGNYQSGSAAHRNGETNRAVQGHSGGAGDSHRGPAHVAGHVAPAQGTGAAGRDSEGWGSALEGAGQQITALNGHVGSMFQSIENALEKLQEAREEMLTSRAAAAARKAAADELLADYTTRLGEARARVAELEDALTGRARAHGAQAATGFSFSEFTPADLAAAVNQVTQATSLFCARLGAALRSTLGPGYFMESGRDSGAARVACERDGKHLLTSLVTGALFLDFENESFTRGGPSCFPDSEERRAVQELEKRQIRAGSIDLDNVSSDPFRKYTVARLEAFAEALAKQFNIAPEKVLQSIHGSETLSEPWVEAATRAWLLQRLARTFSPPAQIVRRARGMPLDAQCERVTEPDAPGFGNRVYLVTMPGFKVGGVVVSKCLVYPDFRPVEAPVTQPGIAPVFRSAENAPGAQQKAAPVFRSAEIAPGAQQKAAPVFDEATKATAGQTSGERKDSLGLPPNEYVQWSENPSFQSASVIDSPRQGVSPGDVTGMALDGPDLEGVVDESAGQSGTGKVHVSPHVISDDFGKDTSAYR